MGFLLFRALPLSWLSFLSLTNDKPLFWSTLKFNPINLSSLARISPTQTNLCRDQSCSLYSVPISLHCSCSLHSVPIISSLLLWVKLNAWLSTLSVKAYFPNLSNISLARIANPIPRLPQANLCLDQRRQFPTNGGTNEINP